MTARLGDGLGRAGDGAAKIEIAGPVAAVAYYASLSQTVKE